MPPPLPFEKDTKPDAPRGVANWTSSRLANARSSNDFALDAARMVGSRLAVKLAVQISSCDFAFGGVLLALYGLGRVCQPLR